MTPSEARRAAVVLLLLLASCGAKTRPILQDAPSWKLASR